MARPTPRIGALLGAALAAAVLVAAPAALAAPSAPVTLTPPGVPGSVPAIATAPDGTTTVAWVSGDHVDVSTRPPGGAFSRPTVLPKPEGFRPAPAPWGIVQGIQLVTGADGTVALAYLAGTTWLVHVRPPGGPFGPPQVLAGCGVTSGLVVGAGAVTVFAPHPAVGPDGTVTVVWDQCQCTWNADVIAQLGTGMAAVRAARAAPGRPFGRPFDVAPGTSVVVPPGGRALHVATGPDGTVTVTWAGGADPRRPPVTSAAGARRIGPRGALGRPVSITPPWAVLARADGGTLLLHGDGLDLVGTVWRADGTLAPSRHLITYPGAPGARLEYPVFTGLSRDGSLAVAASRAWTASDPWSHLTATAIAPDGTAQTPVDMATTQGVQRTPNDPDLAVAPDGAAFLVWRADDDRLYASVRRPGEPFSAPASVSDASVRPTIGASCCYDARVQSVAADPGGTATVVWMQETTDGPVIQAATLDRHPEGGPPAGTPAVTPGGELRAPQATGRSRLVGRARVGRRLRCAPAQFAGATSVAISWLRDGLPVRGRTGTTYRPPRRDAGHLLSCRAVARGAADAQAMSASAARRVHR